MAEQNFPVGDIVWAKWDVQRLWPSTKSRKALSQVEKQRSLIHQREREISRSSSRLERARSSSPQVSDRVSSVEPPRQFQTSERQHLCCFSSGSRRQRFDSCDYGEWSQDGFKNDPFLWQSINKVGSSVDENHDIVSRAGSNEFFLGERLSFGSSPSRKSRSSMSEPFTDPLENQLFDIMGTASREFPPVLPLQSMRCENCGLCLELVDNSYRCSNRSCACGAVRFSSNNQSSGNINSEIRSGTRKNSDLSRSFKFSKRHSSLPKSSDTTNPIGVGSFEGNQADSHFSYFDSEKPGSQGNEMKKTCKSRQCCEMRKGKKVSVTPGMQANGIRYCFSCNGQVRPQKCGGNKHRWRCVFKACRKWYGEVCDNDVIPSDLGKRGRRSFGAQKGSKQELCNTEPQQIQKRQKICPEAIYHRILPECKVGENGHSDRIENEAWEASLIGEIKESGSNTTEIDRSMQTEKHLRHCELRQNLCDEQNISDSDDGSQFDDMLDISSACFIVANSLERAAEQITKGGEPGAAVGDLLMDAYFSTIGPLLSLLTKVPNFNFKMSDFKALCENGAAHLPILSYTH